MLVVAASKYVLRARLAEQALHPSYTEDAISTQNSRPSVGWICTYGEFEFPFA